MWLCFHSNLITVTQHTESHILWRKTMWGVELEFGTVWAEKAPGRKETHSSLHGAAPQDHQPWVHALEASLSLFSYLVLFLLVKRSLSTNGPGPKRTSRNRVSIIKSLPLGHPCWFSWVVPSGSEPTSHHNRRRHRPVEVRWLGVLGSWFLGPLKHILGLRHRVMDGFSGRIFCNLRYHSHSPRP